MKSRSETFTRLLAAGLGAALIVSLSSRPGPAVQADDKPAADQDGVLTDDSLRKILTDLAYTFTDSPDKSHVRFFVKIERNDWTLTHEVLLSANKQLLLMMTNGQEIPKEKMASADRFRALLENNNGFAAHFALDKRQSGSFATRLNRFVPNRGLKPTVMRKLLDDYDSFMRATTNLWAAAERWDDKVVSSPTAAMGDTAPAVNSASSTIKKKP